MLEHSFLIFSRIHWLWNVWKRHVPCWTVLRRKHSILGPSLAVSSVHLSILTKMMLTSSAMDLQKQTYSAQVDASSEESFIRMEKSGIIGLNRLDSRLASSAPAGWVVSSPPKGRLSIIPNCLSTRPNGLFFIVLERDVEMRAYKVSAFDLRV